MLGAKESGNQVEKIDPIPTVTEQEMNIILSIDTNKRLLNDTEDEEVKRKITSWILDI